MSRFYRQGEVVFITGDRAEIQLSISGFCSGTHKCALTSLTNSIPADRNRVRAKNSIGARKGEKVIIEVLSPGFYRSLFFVFFFPLIALFLGILSGIQIAVWMDSSHKSDLYAGVGAIVLFSVSLLLSRFINQNVHPLYLVQSRVDKSLNCDNCSLAVRG